MTSLRTLKHVSRLAAAFALTTALTLTAAAQAPTEPSPAPSKSFSASGPTVNRTFFLKNVSQQNEQNEILTAIRNMIDPRTKITLVPAQSAINIDTTADQMEKAEKLINELDRRRPTYRLIYTLIDFDGAKRLGDQHYTMVLIPGQRTVLKQGNKIPVVTGTDFKNPSNSQAQVTYIDVGMGFEATIDDSPNVIRLRSKVEQSSVIEASATAQDPVLRQAVYEGTSTLTPGKPLTIGSLDTAGTTRRIEIQATIEPIP